MSKINLHNYEAYLLDLHEGNLSQEDTAELELFLNAHPELREELEPFNLPVLEAEEIAFDEKEFIKRKLDNIEITASNETHYIIAASEGDLSTSEHLAFLNYLDSHTDAANEYAVYQQLRLKADQQLVFPNKKKLKKRVVVVRQLYPALAVAAGLLLLFQLNVFFQRTNVEQNPHLHATVTQPAVAEYFVLNSLQNHPLNFNREKVDNYNKRNSEKTIEAKSAPVKTTLPIASKNVVDTTSQLPVRPEFKEEYVVEHDTTTSPGTPAFAQAAPELEKENESRNEAEVRSYDDQEFIAFGDYVKDRLVRIVKGKKTETLENETSVAEHIGHGISTAVGGKLTLEKDEKGETMAFAIKIGKFSFSRK